MSKNYADHEVATINSFRNNPAFAAQYLSAVLEDGDTSAIMTAVRRVSDAGRGISAIAAETELNSKTLYKTLSPKGNPSLKSLLAILSALNLKLAVLQKHG